MADVKTLVLTHGLVAALTFGVWPYAARAQSARADQKAAAEVLFTDARRAMEASDFVTACSKLERSQQIDASVGTLGWLGRCYEKLGKTASAWANYRAAASLAQRRGDTERGALAAERASALEPTLSWLTIDATAIAELPSVEVKRNGLTVPRSDWSGAFPVDPGIQLLEIRAPGYQSADLRVSVGTSGAREIARVPALIPDPKAVSETRAVPPNQAARPSGESPSPPPPRAHARATPGTSGQAIAGYAVAGVGIAGLGVGLAFFLERSSQLGARDDACPGAPPGDCPSESKRVEYEARQGDAKRAATVSMVSSIAGAALLTTGAVLWLTAPSAASRAERAKRAKNSAELRPLAWRDGGGLWLESTW